MKAVAEKIDPEQFILAALTPAQRLEAAFRMARDAFRHTDLTPADIEAAVQKVRKSRYAKSRKATKGRR